ncbi:DUF4249 domain-containing protein [Pedobacter gandavensis]|uniref:DUF4249 family protein n=1 Tax=Pedobacter gandavensis TaxID=2679963 RepID=A0ABR6EWY2_9SPHI|nr:DUF4249 domain-containing protein [Pedobacter gandavensis]MBB2149707.1 DUF4249 family protein [Pedobacter gandavensis]
MKNISYLLLLIPVLLGSCDKVIDLKYTDNEVKYVIEGTITNEPGSCTVLLSKTRNFKDSNPFNGLSGASVKIENNGNTYTLLEDRPGVYKLATLIGVPGQTYQLTVSVEGETFSASSRMPTLVPFDDFYLKPKDFDSLRTITYVKYKDPANETNFYWFELFVNDKRQRNYSLMNDQFTPGQEVTTPIIFQNKTDDLSRNFKKGDKLALEMHSIDASVYLYLFSLSAAEGSDNGAAPANPLSNLKGGALGFFSAHTTQKRTLVIP